VDGQLVGSIYNQTIVTALRSKPARVGAGVH